MQHDMLIALASATLGALFVYGLPNGRPSAFGLKVGKIPDVFGVGRRALRRSLHRAERRS